MIYVVLFLVSLTSYGQTEANLAGSKLDSLSETVSPCLMFQRVAPSLVQQTPVGRPRTSVC